MHRLDTDAGALFAAWVNVRLGGVPLTMLQTA